MLYEVKPAQPAGWSHDKAKQLRWPYFTFLSLSLATVTLEGQKVTEVEKILRISAPVHAYCILTGKHATSCNYSSWRQKRLIEINFECTKNITSV